MRMTDEECRLYVSAAAMGHACGLTDPWEFALNIQLHAMSLFPYAELGAREDEFCGAILAFLRSAACDAWEEAAFSAMTLQEFKASSARQLNRRLSELELRASPETGGPC